MKKAKAPSSSEVGRTIETDPDIKLARLGDSRARDCLFYRAQSLVRSFSAITGIGEDEARSCISAATAVVLRKQVYGSDRPMTGSFFLKAVSLCAANLVRAERTEQHKIAFSLDALGDLRDEIESATGLRSTVRRNDRKTDWRK